MKPVVLRFRGIFCFPDILCIFVLSFKEVHEAAVERQHYSWAPGWNKSPHPSGRAGRVVCSTKSKQKPTHKNTLREGDNWGQITGERGCSSQEREEGPKSVGRHFLAFCSLIRQWCSPCWEEGVQNILARWTKTAKRSKHLRLTRQRQNTLICQGLVHSH